jgi:hypothetical protein
MHISRNPCKIVILDFELLCYNVPGKAGEGAESILVFKVIIYFY